MSGGGGVLPTALWHRLDGVLLAAGGVAILVAAAPGWPWWVWPLALLWPDLGAAGYAGGPRIGAAVYNALHLPGAALLLAVAGLSLGTGVLALGGAWLVHIGVDRACGFGLKRPEGFRHTDLGDLR